jgi:hypothetical protein
MTAELMDTLVDHSAGNHRSLMIMGGELLAYCKAHELAQLDEKCCLELLQPWNSRRLVVARTSVCGRAPGQCHRMGYYRVLF